MAFISRIYSLLAPVGHKVTLQWARYRALRPWLQAAIGIGAALLIIWIGYGLFSKGAVQADETALPTVALSRVDALSGSGGSIGVIGSVRSVAEADVLAQSGGTVTALNARLGQYVGAGFVIASLENASQRAAVLQAEGSYEAALSAREGTSPADIAASARNTYTSTYSTLDTLLTRDVGTFFGAPTSYGPMILINAPMYRYGELSEERDDLSDLMDEYQKSLALVSSSDPATLLTRAGAVVQQISSFVDKLSIAANDRESDATATQLAALATARTGLATVQASITAAKAAFQGQNTSATAGADATVKIALGSLRAAQAQLEKTLIRAPIAGTINFLPIRRGDYVTALMHVATVAQNGTLEIVASVSEETRALLSVGMKVTVEGTYPAVVTSIAPALDPVTKQIEVRIILSGKNSLVNGQSVRITIPSSAPVIQKSAGPLLLPLTAVKLTPSARVVFSVGSDERLVAHQVEIGDVHGDRIEIRTPLPSDLEIVTDARGLSEGQKVAVSLPL